MAWEENPRICLHMQLIAILSRTGVTFLPCTHTNLFHLMDRMKKRQTYEVCRYQSVI